MTFLVPTSIAFIVAADDSSDRLNVYEQRCYNQFTRHFIYQKKRLNKYFEIAKEEQNSCLSTSRTTLVDGLLQDETGLARDVILLDLSHCTLFSNVGRECSADLFWKAGLALETRMQKLRLPSVVDWKAFLVFDDPAPEPFLPTSYGFHMHDPSLPHMPPSRRTHRHRRTVSNATARPNIYVLVLDSTSRATLRSFMSRLRGFLNRSSATHVRLDYSMYHQHTWGNTFSSLTPIMLGGHGPCVANRSIKSWDPSAIDRCSKPGRRLPRFLRRQGYRTYYSSPYAYGFATMREDFDFDFPDVKKLWQPRVFHPILGGPDDLQCVGSLPLYQHYLKINHDLLSRQQEGPLFVFTHLFGSHANPAHAGLYDEALTEHLEKVEQDSPHTMIILMADHGSSKMSCDLRFPFMSVILPHALAGRWHSFKHNVNKLISAWDIYATIRHVAQQTTKSQAEAPNDDWFGLGEVLHLGSLETVSFSGEPVYSINLSKGIFRPFSLAQDIPENRTCREAGIDETHCAFTLSTSFTCDFPADHSSNECNRVSHYLQSVVQYLNAELGRMLAGGDGCRSFTLNKLGPHRVTSYNSFAEVQVLLNEGDPQRVFQAAVREADGELDVFNLIQITQYAMYEHCTPPNVAPLLCVCG